jgi:drug/metabolite transporter (DMT)-like permease
MNRHAKAHLAALAANLIYGANYHISKSVMPSKLLPDGFILLRVATSALLFWLSMRWLAGREPVSRRDYLRFFLLGFFGVAVNQLLFFEGLALTTAVDASLIISTNPVLVLLAASLILKERITTRKILGIAAGVSGAALLILSQQAPAQAGGSLRGDILIFVNAASYAVFLVMAKPLMAKYHPVRVITWTFLFGTVIVLPFGWHQLTLVQWEAFGAWDWTAVAYVCVFSTFLAYLLNVIGLKQLSPATLSYYIYVQPLFATAVTLAVTGEPVTAVQVISCLLIFGGVYLVSGRALAVAKS